MSRTYGVLFLCTGNTARSIMAEAILNHAGSGRFRAFSAGSFPKGRVHPLTLEQLKQAGISTTGLRSKSWDEFATPDAPQLDFIFTVCDSAAGEICPVWPGKPITAHWGIADPAEAGPGRQPEAFAAAFHALKRRIDLFLALPLDSIDELGLQSQLCEIGKTADQRSDAI
ncbi:MAG TPA: arsenate reductase ArsC [Sphingomicrobium sp.]|nr:arsenate reductase ArsC [Sphingomicrobium sp.]